MPRIKIEIDTETQVAVPRDELVKISDWLYSSANIQQHSFDEPPEPASQFDHELVCASKDLAMLAAAPQPEQPKPANAHGDFPSPDAGFGGQPLLFDDAEEQPTTSAYTAADMASQAAQGFRDGVESVNKQPAQPIPSCNHGSAFPCNTMCEQSDYCCSPPQPWR